MNKNEVRERMLEALSTLPEKERKEQDENIMEKLRGISELKASKCIFAYIGIDYEIRTEKIIEAMLFEGKTVCVPLCHGKGRMDAIKITSMSELSPGRYGIPEPPKDGEKVIPSEIDAILVPGVAFDEKGKRLGRGGGYYDRFMECAENAVKIALCREVNLLSCVPCEEHDQSVDIVVTEKRIIRKEN